MDELKSALAEEKNVDGNVNDFMTMMDSNMDQLVVHDEVTKRLDIACANLDIAGYNYMTARYELDGKIRPNRVIVGSETYPPEIGRNGELVYITVTNRDAEGVTDTWQKLHLSCRAEGAAEIRFGSGDPKTANNYMENETDTWNGRALLIVRRTKVRQPVRVTVCSEKEKITLSV